MSTIDFKTKPVDKERARKMVREIVTKAPGKVAFGSHAQQELANDGYSIMDGWNILKSPAARITRVEPEKGRIRYHLETKQLALVLEFWSDGKGFFVVTGWAKRGVVR
jgi:hypothetical protein